MTADQWYQYRRRMPRRQSRREMAKRHSHADGRGAARHQMHLSGIETPGVFLLTLVTGVLAGFVDSIAGGGGLLTLPVLLTLLPSPTQTVATLKAQNLFGTLAATVHFTRQGLVQPRTKIAGIVSALAGGAAGAIAVQVMSPALLMTMVPILLVAVALYVACSPRASDIDSQQRLSPLWFGILVIPAIAFYAGFFGPGTGVFFMIAFVALRGYGLLKAIANTKLLDCMASAGAVLLFLAGGQIVWPVAIVMGIGQALGAYAGATFVIRRGAAVVRPVLVVVSLTITCKLVFDNPESWMRQLVEHGIRAFAG